MPEGGRDSAIVDLHTEGTMQSFLAEPVVFPRTRCSYYATRPSSSSTSLPRAQNVSSVFLLLFERDSKRDGPRC